MLILSLDNDRCGVFIDRMLALILNAGERESGDLLYHEAEIMEKGGIL